MALEQLVINIGQSHFQNISDWLVIYCPSKAFIIVIRLFQVSDKVFLVLVIKFSTKMKSKTTKIFVIFQLTLTILLSIFFPPLSAWLNVLVATKLCLSC